MDEDARQFRKTIQPDDVALGMYIHGFTGGWFHHPFWRTRFLLEDEDDLLKIQQSDVSGVIIDETKGARFSPRQNTIVPNLARNSSVVPVRSFHSGKKAASVAPVNKADDRLSADMAHAERTVSQSKKVMKNILNGARLGKTIRTADVISVVEDITASLERNNAMLLRVVSLKNKDEYTYMHSVAVCALMVNLGRTLGLDTAVVRELGVAGLLHDVGKMVVPEAILNKPGPLTESEFAEMREHSLRGHELLSAGVGVPEAALDVCLHHHERMDGKGYPKQLAGDNISLFARMGAICDVYDAMTSRRCYKDPFSAIEAITMMRSWQGHFDDKLLFQFMRSIGVLPADMLVRLRSNQLAVVLPNGRRASRPRVMAFFAITTKTFTTPKVITLSDSLGSDQVISEEIPAAWGFSDWDNLRASIVEGQSIAA